MSDESDEPDGRFHRETVVEYPLDLAVKALGEDAYITACVATAELGLPFEEVGKYRALSLMFIRSIERDGLEGLQAIEHAIDLCRVAGDRLSVIAIICSVLWRHYSNQLDAREYPEGEECEFVQMFLMNGQMRSLGEVIAAYIHRTEINRTELVLFLALIVGIPIPPGYTD